MKAGETTDEQIVGILQEAEKGEKKIADEPNYDAALAALAGN